MIPRNEAKLNTCRNPACAKPYKPQRSFQEACSVPCSIVVASLKSIKREERKKLNQRRENRRNLREWRLKNITVAKLKAQADKEFGRYIRERDHADTCICCDGVPDALTAATLAVKGHLWDAGHWRSKGAADHLRYNEDNCHKQLVSCNRDKSGNSVAYRVRLIKKIGIERVEALENDNRTVKWDRDELVQIRRTYLAKWKAARAAREAMVA
jgi:hypothetical protein